MQEVEDHLKNISHDLETKADKDLMEIVRDDKVSKSDFIHNLPVYLVEQNM